MDEQTQQLLALLMSNAKSGNKNISSILGNLDNPIFSGMAGVLDPYYGTGVGGGGDLYSSFAADETTPAAVKAVMDYVDQGMNAYQIEAQINALDPDVIKDSGYTDQQLISMGKEMSKQGGKQANDVFKKAGLRNPNDIYGLSDVPLNDVENKYYAKYLTRAKENQKPIGDLGYQYEVAQQRLKELRDSGTINDPFANAMINASQNMPTDYIKQGMINAAGSAPQDYMMTSAREKASQDMPIDYIRQGMINAAKNAPRDYIKEGMIASAQESPGDYMMTSAKEKAGAGRRAPTQEERDAVSRALANKVNQETAVNYDLMRAQAVRKGALNRATRAGRTPFTDQTSALLKFIAGTK